VGKELAPGITLAEVHPRYVMLSDGGVMKRVDLATDAKAAAPMGGPGAVPPGGAPQANGQPNGQPNFAQPQQITTAPAMQPTQVNVQPEAAQGAAQQQSGFTSPGDVGSHDGAPPPANPNPINQPQNPGQPPRGGDNPAGQTQTQ
jgi:general secretion pathway protein C